MTTPVLWALTVSALAVFAWRFWTRLRPLLVARPAHRTDRLTERLGFMVGDVGLHRRLLRFGYSGILHACILSGFIVLLTAIVESFGSGLFPGFSLAPVGGETWLALLQNIFAVVMAIGLGMAIHHRFVIRPERLEGSRQGDATAIYVLASAIVLSMILEASARLAIDGEGSAWRPLSTLFMVPLRAVGILGPAAAMAEALFYWVHVGLILAFLVYIPGSKHRHMFTAAPNIVFRPLTPKGALPAPDDDGGTVQGYRDFTWKDLLDTLSCTECGRCQSVCPAHAGGKPLSPKTLIMDLRDGYLTDQGLLKSPDHAMPIVGGTIRPETLWSCTTCRACMEVCPVHIEHVPKIVKLRRSLVEDGNIEPLLKGALTNVQSQGNSFGKPARQRARWTKGLSHRIKDARREPVDVLWFVGDFASFDPRVEKLTRQVAELLHRAGVDLGILYDGEHNSGNDVRRAGDEGLFEMLAAHNIEQLDACAFDRIMTTDPHSLNALKSEYPALGADYEVIHYSELFLDLVKTGRLRPGPVSARRVTYHDPCFLGRYNGGFDAPRALIRALGHELVDMPRCRENSFCCGAGGGRIFMDDPPGGERPSESRIREAMALGGIDTFAVSCPKDVVMYSTAVQDLGVGHRIEVRDLAELVFESVAVP